MNKFRSLGLALIALVGVALIQFAAPPAFATAETVTQNTHGIFVKGAASGIFAPAQICYATDGSGNFIPCGKVPGGLGLLPGRLVTSSTNIPNNSYVTLFSNLPAAATWVSVYNGSSQEIVIATNSTSPVNKFYVPATTKSDVGLYLPAGSYVMVESMGATVSSGDVLINFLQ